jgi:hypothetical protein
MKVKWFTQLFLISVLILVLATIGSSSAKVSAQATPAATMAATGPEAPPPGKMRWDIISVSTKDGKQTISAGGIAYASANDGSYISYKGTGTYGPGISDPVTGGGDWATFDAGNRPTGSGKYTVTAFAGFDWTAGKEAPTQVDTIGKAEDFVGGVATLRIAYSNADGSSAGNGFLIISCHPPAGAVDSIVEGVVGSKRGVLFYSPAHIAPGIDQGRTNFHFVR